MIKDEDYKQVALHSSLGGMIGIPTELGIKILVAGIECNSDEMRLAQKYASMLHEELCQERWSLDPVVVKHRADEIRLLVSCFPEGTFIELTANEYDSRYGFPWIIGTIKLGRIKIGWRKRVIVVDWSDAPNITDEGYKLFESEDVTKTRFMIHAYGYDKCKEYIDKLLTLPVPPLLVEPPVVDEKV